MIGNIRRDGFPTVKLIDFGSAALLQNGALSQQTIDTQRFCGLFAALNAAHGHYDYHRQQRAQRLAAIQPQPAQGPILPPMRAGEGKKPSGLSGMFKKSSKTSASSSASKGKIPMSLKGKGRATSPPPFSSPLERCTSHPQEWDAFLQAMRDISECRIATPSMTQVLQRWAPMARLVCGNVSPNVKQYIQEVTNAAIRNQGYANGVNDNTIKRMIKSYDPEQVLASV